MLSDGVLPDNESLIVLCEPWVVSVAKGVRPKPIKQDD
jgi:hypothetical protein